MGIYTCENDLFSPDVVKIPKILAKTVTLNQ